MGRREPNVPSDAIALRAMCTGPGRTWGVGNRTCLLTLSPFGRCALVMAGALNIIARDYLGYPSAREVPWHRLRYEHVQAVRTRLGEKYKPATANRYLSALNGVRREAWRLGAYPGEELERVRDVRSVPGSALPAGRALSKGELKALMDGCADGTPMGSRDAAVIALGYGAGLRRTEIAGLALEDVRSEGTGMSDEAVAVILSRCAARAGVGKLSPHDLRRSFVSDLLDAGVDIATVAAMAGHSRVTTTQRYDRRGEEAKRKAAGTLHVPYARKKR